MRVPTRRGTGRPRRTGAANGPRTPLCGRRPAADPQRPAFLERRTVSVLFVDIVGFTELAGRLEPEEVYAVQRAYFRIVAQVVREFHGIVEKYVGDAVMAAFGARRPDAGDDAYRAVCAGTEVVRRVRAAGFPGGHRLRVRAGVATGVVAVDPATARDGGHGFVSGMVVNTAARVQAHAAADTVAVTEATRAATGDRIRYLRLGPVNAAGIPGTLRLWRPAGPGPGQVRSRIPQCRTTDRQRVTSARQNAPSRRWCTFAGATGGTTSPRRAALSGPPARSGEVTATGGLPGADPPPPAAGRGPDPSRPPAWPP